ncbi:hypothetical protein SAMN05444166_0595 [Singulisphaera sp. GP187]|uniref:hypothetical protein n=1 Tax=Singulisphaera sp. GP187 TaxID=1882752 RepID=UPI00092955B4|nr:hypothetical protein [Singulisphaera sp. GP187]SIN74514.1 hypothetical protein SAMN05444166_0595 [Singulisphaera sp. GP187]
MGNRLGRVFAECHELIPTRGARNLTAGLAIPTEEPRQYAASMILEPDPPTHRELRQSAY